MSRGASFVADKRISNKANETLAAVGGTCENVPDNAIDSLEARGAIHRVAVEPEPELEKPAKRGRGRRAKKSEEQEPPPESEASGEDLPEED